MAGQKKKETIAKKNKSSKKNQEEDDDLDLEEIEKEILEEDEIEEDSKKAKKNKKTESSKTAKKSKKSNKEEDSDDPQEDEDNSKYDKKSSKKNGKKEELEDEMSDINLEDEEIDDAPVIKANKQNALKTKSVDPKTPIGELKIDDILAHLYQRGMEEANPTLRHCAEKSYRELFYTNNRRRYPKNPRTGYIPMDSNYRFSKGNEGYMPRPQHGQQAQVYSNSSGAGMPRNRPMYGGPMQRSSRRDSYGDSDDIYRGGN